MFLSRKETALIRRPLRGSVISPIQASQLLAFLFISFSQNTVPLIIPSLLNPSGNVVWLIDSSNYWLCDSFNNPPASPNVTTLSTCMVSETCVTVVARHMCSLYCGSCGANGVLPPCLDSCEAYTQCKNEFNCLPNLPGTCSSQSSNSPNSYLNCTYLSVNLDSFPGDSSPASRLSPFGLYTTLLFFLF